MFLDPEPKDGYQGLFINARAGDVQALNEAIELIADALKTLGHPGTANQRRAEAAGIIADPQAALDLIARAEAVRQAQRDAAAARRAGDVEAAEQIEQTPARRRRPGPTVREAAAVRVLHRGPVSPPEPGDPRPDAGR